MGYKYFDGVYKRAYRVLIEGLNRLFKALQAWKLITANSKPVEAKRLLRLGRGNSPLIRGNVGFNMLGDFT